MIYYFSPYNTQKKLGVSYNQCMSLLPNDDDWACFTDGDVLFLTPDYGTQLEHIVEKYKDDNVGLFTCFTNRVGNLSQCYNNIISEDGDIRNHRKIALKLRDENYSNVIEFHSIISGHLMLVQKKVWNACKFKEEGILAVDNNFSRKVLNKGFKIYLMAGVYVFHYYRMLEGRLDKSHLK